METLTAQEYEDKAQQCHRLAWFCTDPRTLGVLKGLAREYDLMAAVLRAREDRRASYKDRVRFRGLRHEYPRASRRRSIARAIPPATGELAPPKTELT
jgi:hypothetical protein